ncbi:hypothetical protein HHK36_024879 [Tetracentron sinense]|uniref:Thiol-disulfide oxidoreductase DCC n=1 Tax=Tetracentron sinense TaxID=13715 RepID=A0A834YK48_TETSI|nr:hypothetical protein HHK36_024879 [Tetracentron sinense]
MKRRKPTNPIRKQQPKLKMALRAVACIGRQRNSSILSASHHFRFRFRDSAALPLPIFSHPRNQTALNFRVRAIHDTTSDLKTSTNSKKEDEQLSQNWKIKMLYDGDCPLCMREVNMLRERNKLYGAIEFVDISSDEYSPEQNQGLDYETVMGRIHAIQSDGTVVTDVEAFRRLYEEVGLGWVYAITKYEPIAKIADAVYGVWAKYRMQITGRPPLEEIFEARKRNKGEVCNDSKACKM